MALKIKVDRILGTVREADDTTVLPPGSVTADGTTITISPDGELSVGSIPSNKVTGLPPAPEDPKITITQGGVEKGSFSLNQKAPATIDLDDSAATGVSSVNGQTGSVTLDGDNLDLSQEVTNLFGPEQTIEPGKVYRSVIDSADVTPIKITFTGDGTRQQSSLLYLTIKGSGEVTIDWGDTVPQDAPKEGLNICVLNCMKDYFGVTHKSMFVTATV